MTRHTQTTTHNTNLSSPAFWEAQSPEDIIEVYETLSEGPERPRALHIAQHQLAGHDWASVPDEEVAQVRRIVS